MSPRIEPINPPTLPKPAGFSYGYRAEGGRVLFIAGQVAMDASGKVVGRGDIVAQFRQVCDNIRTDVDVVTHVGHRASQRDRDAWARMVSFGQARGAQATEPAAATSK